MLRRHAILSVALMAAMALSACERSPSTAVPVDGPVPPGTRLPLAVQPYSSANYRDHATSVILTPFPDTVWHCDREGTFSLDTNPDIEHAYRFRNDTLHMMLETESVSGYGSTGNLDSARIETYVEFARVGSGTGLEGRWQAVRNVFKVLEGNPPESTRLEYERRVAKNNLQTAYLTWELGFDDGVLHSRLDGRMAEWLVIDWNEENTRSIEDGPSGFYDVQVSAPARYTIQYKGRRSGETVTKIMEPPFIERYSSDNPAHPPYTDYYSPHPRCDEISQNHWFQGFLTDNRNQPQ